MGGLWPVKDSAVVSAHEAGLDGSGVKIGMLDSRVVSDYPGLSDADANVEYRLGSFANATTDEPAKCLIEGVPLQKTVTSKEGNIYSSHGTFMLTWLVGNGKSWGASQGVTGLVPKSDVLFLTLGQDTSRINMLTPCDDFAMPDIDKDVSTAVDWGARIINMSNEGGIGDYGLDGMLKALRHGVIIVSSRSNDKETDAIVNGSSTDVMIGDPRMWNSFPGVIRNNEVGPDGQIAGISDVADANVNILSPGDQVLHPQVNSKIISVGTGGTSTGAAVLSGYLALTVQKWPDATGNQILQSLVRNTKGNDSGEAKLDPEHKRGYGQVDPGRLLTVDPTQYPDVNPILEAQVTTASKLSDDRSKWYTQDCSTNPDGVGSLLDDDSYPVFCQAGEIGREYERQKAAWKKVEQCRSDGGSDCMRYSATATADETEGKSDGRTVLPGTGDGKDGVKSSGVPVWVWLAAGGVGVAVVAGGIVLAVVLSKRGKQGRRPLPDAAAAGPSPYAGPRQPVPGMAYPNRPYSPQYGGPGSRPVPQYQAPGPAQVPSQYRRNVGPVSPQYAQPQSQQPNPVQSPPVRPNPIQPSPAQPYPSCPQPSTGQVPNPADGHGREQAYPPRSNQPHR
ncbi:S8 family serine peptidase [Bifidobacterium longum]|uniref:S8 family serine peptidase n=2 Tax=Bifidobacterium longum TaxID=216816 RepID=UPI001BE4DB7E|nr:S8 family serine peptidase [Bifidobacterium longum]